MRLIFLPKKTTGAFNGLNSSLTGNHRLQVRRVTPLRHASPLSGRVTPLRHASPLSGRVTPLRHASPLSGRLAHLYWQLD